MITMTCVCFLHLYLIHIFHFSVDYRCYLVNERKRDAWPIHEDNVRVPASPGVKPLNITTKLPLHENKSKFDVQLLDAPRL